MLFHLKHFIGGFNGGKMNLTGKKLTELKAILKKMLTVVNKYGKSKDGIDTISVYYYYNDEEIYPVLISYQDINPWGPEFHPSKIFIVGQNFPKSINVFSKNNSDFKVSTSYRYLTSTFRETFNTLKTFTYDGDCIEEFKDNIIDNSTGDYVSDKFYSIDSVKNIVNNITESTKWAHSGKESCERIYSELTEMSQIILDEFNIRLYSSIYPIKFDEIFYMKSTLTSNLDKSTTVYAKQCVSPIVVHNFYRYVEIDEDIKIDEESNSVDVEFVEVVEETTDD